MTASRLVDQHRNQRFPGQEDNGIGVSAGHVTCLRFYSDEDSHLCHNKEWKSLFSL